jgi:hypothetical protein
MNETLDIIVLLVYLTGIEGRTQAKCKAQFIVLNG